MALRSVADNPFFANASKELGKWVAAAQKVPVGVYRFGLIALALLWVTHTIASLFWVLLAPPALPTPKVTAAQMTLEPAGHRDIDIDPTLATNMFGQYDEAAPVEETAPAVVADENIKDSKLNIEVQGLVAAPLQEDSWAIIGRGDNQKLYKVGDEIEGNRGVKVAKIYDIRMVVNNNGSLEQIWLYGEDGKDFAKSRAQTTQRPVERDDGPEKVVISQEDIKKPKNIADVVRFMVATDNGKMIGYKVRPGRQRELFDQVGLKTDDIVVSVNGIEVNEPQKVREVYQALKTATEANLEVLRDGSTHSIQITMSSEG